MIEFIKGDTTHQEGKMKYFTLKGDFYNNGVLWDQMNKN